MSARDDYPRLAVLHDAWVRRSDLPQPEAVRAFIEIDRLRDLAEYARHAEGCSAPFGYRCKCGYERTARSGAGDA